MYTRKEQADVTTAAVTVIVMSRTTHFWSVAFLYRMTDISAMIKSCSS